jgi:carbamate kinase
MRKKIVIALGGNALGNSPSEQLDLVKVTAKNIVDLVEAGNKVIVTHGNGPQVGMINLAMEVSHQESDTPEMPFAECGAMSQGYIGYHLQQSIQKELVRRSMRRNCLTVITQVEVDKEDPAFNHPTKPIGSFYTEEEAKKIEKEKGYVFKEDSGRGYRRVVPSPKPIDIIESKPIKLLVDNDIIVISVGGGGIPVVKRDKIELLEGVDAVIDKDMSSALLAKKIDADILLILTAVDKVCINFKSDNPTELDVLTSEEAKKYIENKEFAEGSMLPKINACLDFVLSGENKKAIITSLNQAGNALSGNVGTTIIK